MSFFGRRLSRLKTEKGVLLKMFATIQFVFCKNGPLEKTKFKYLKVTLVFEMYNYDLLIKNVTSKRVPTQMRRYGFLFHII